MRRPAQTEPGTRATVPSELENWSTWAVGKMSPAAFIAASPVSFSWGPLLSMRFLSCCAAKPSGACAGLARRGSGEVASGKRLTTIT